jgi:hypothetical protein
MKFMKKFPPLCFFPPRGADESYSGLVIMYYKIAPKSSCSAATKESAALNALNYPLWAILALGVFILIHYGSAN